MKFQLAEVMRYSILFDFFLLLSLLIFPPEREPGTIAILHTIMIVVNGCLSAWKGWKIDGKLLFAAHHIVTHFFFFLTTSMLSAPLIGRHLITMLIYLVMRLVKRFKDDGWLTKEQWIKFYGYYCYCQTAVILHTHVMATRDYDTTRITMIDAVGILAQLDSLYTCRKEDVGTKILGLSTPGAKDSWIVKYKNILSILDVASIWGALLFMFFFASTTIQSYAGFIAFFVMEFFIKRIPAFKTFARPYVYKYTNPEKSSFPSTHMVIVAMAVPIISANWIKMMSIISMGIYRVATRAHTVDDVCAGLAIGVIFNVLV